MCDQMKWALSIQAGFSSVCSTGINLVSALPSLNQMVHNRQKAYYHQCIFIKVGEHCRKFVIKYNTYILDNVMFYVQHLTITIGVLSGRAMWASLMRTTLHGKIA